MINKVFNCVSSEVIYSDKSSGVASNILLMMKNLLKNILVVSLILHIWYVDPLQWYIHQLQLSASALQNL